MDNANAVAWTKGRAVLQIDAFELIPFGLICRRGEVCFVVVGAKVQPKVLNTGLFALGLGHSIDRADNPASVAK